MSDQKKTADTNRDKEFAKRRRELLKKSGKLAAAAPAVALLLSSGSGMALTNGS